MVGVSVQSLHVESRPGAIGKSPKKVLEELGGKISHSIRGEPDSPTEVGTSREIDHHSGQRLVQRNVSYPEPVDSRLVAPRRRQPISENESHVLHRMMKIHVEI